jgi:toxin ParE1/3/4
MRVEYSKRALADLRQLAAYYAWSGKSAIADRIAERIQQVIARIAVSPLSGRAVVGRPDVRVALLPGYRYKIFYRVAGGAIRIVHIATVPGARTINFGGRPFKTRWRGHKHGQRYPHSDPPPLVGEGREGARCGNLPGPASF